MGFSITARWPLGTYLGHRADGSPEPLPTLTRLYSALVKAAATGATADPAGVDPPATITPASQEALAWIEENPPYGMVVPAYPELIPSSGRMHVTAYRKEGVFDRDVSFAGRVTARTFADATTISAPLGWVWDESPSRETLDHLDALCADVHSLGEAESLVVLELHREVDAATCTHRIEKSSFFEDRGMPVDIPVRGRLDALESQHRESHPRKLPTVAKDKHRTGPAGQPSSETPTRDGVAPRALVPVDLVEAETPWATVVLLPVTSGPMIGAEGRVRVARDLHRALISLIGQECPPVVTGHYDEGAVRPANRVALHYLPPGSPLGNGSTETAHLAVMIPRGVAASDHDLVLEAAHRLQKLRTPLGVLHLGQAEITTGDRLWAPPAEGTVREWRTDPVAIPERQFSAPTRAELLAQTTAWALGNVLRGIHADAGARTPAERLEWLRSQGGEVVEAEPFLTPHPARFVHRTNRTMPVMPYSARVTLGDLVPTTAALAIGQSRHLGGGLLVPVDRRETPRRGHARHDD